MVDFITKLVLKIIFACVIYFGIGALLFIDMPMTDFLLSLLASHFLLDKLEFDSKEKKTDSK